MVTEVAVQFGAVSPDPHRNVAEVFRLAPVAKPLAPVIAANVAEVPGAKLRVSGVAFGPMVGVSAELAFNVVESVTT